MGTYTLAKATLQQVLQKHPATIRSFENTHVQKVLHRLQVCRTSALGYHAYQCTSEDCRYIKYQYHSCRDRHCPSCGALKKQ